MAEFRKFALNAFRGFGIGKRSFEKNIAMESTALIEVLDTKNGNTCSPYQLLNNCTANVLCAVVFGNRYDYDDDEFCYLTDLLRRIMHLLGEGAWSIMVPKYYQNKDTIEALKLVKDINKFVGKRVSEHKMDYDSEDMRDFIDTCLKAIEGSPKIEDPYSYLQEDNMIAVLFQLFLAGTSTTAETLEWCCLYMMVYPEVQEKIQQEMDEVVGRNRLPLISDQDDLPYTRSVLLEIQRHVTVAPLGVFHTTSDDVFIQGYRIPKVHVFIRQRSAYVTPWKLDQAPFITTIEFAW